MRPWDRTEISVEEAWAVLAIIDNPAARPRYPLTPVRECSIEELRQRLDRQVEERLSS